MDKLDMILQMQAELNDLVFAKQRLASERMDGTPLTMAEIIAAAKRPEEHGPNHLPNVWLGKYLQALDAESTELKASLLWKWWSKDKIDMQNVRVEIIDMLHFLISLALVSGMSANDIYTVYLKKYEVNKRRQHEGYSVATKTEDDNKGITVQ